jgi:hypothetical protein
MARKGEHWSEKERLSHAGDPQGWLDQGRVKIKIAGRNTLLHRHIMEQHLGRKLDPQEVVHHVNGNSQDNRIENLRVISPGVHTVHHNTGRKLSESARANMREGAKKRPPRSAESKRKTSEALLAYYALKKQTG